MVFVISSIPERDKQHFQGEKKKSCYQKAKKGENFTFPCILFPHWPSPLRLPSLPRGFHSAFRFGLFSVILLSPFVLPAWFLIGPTCPLSGGNRYFLDKLFL